MGNPERLAEVVVEEAEKRLMSKLDEALEAARRLVAESYERILKETLSRIREEVRSLREKLSALEAAKTVEARKEISKIKSEFIERAVREAFARFRERVPRERYVMRLEELLRAATEQVRVRSDQVVIIPVESDREIVAQLVAKLRQEGLPVELSEKSISGLGGFVAQDAEGSVRLDYRLESVLGNLIEEARTIALRKLFPE